MLDPQRPKSGIKSTVTFVYRKRKGPYVTGLHYTQLQEITGNPEQIADA